MKQNVVIGLCIAVIAFGGWRMLSSSCVQGAGEIPAGKPVMNVETGYRYALEIDRDFAGWPAKCPDTGKLTCYPAEVCLWNQCKNVNVQGFQGTWVVLNETQGLEGPTKCPACGHSVRVHNPRPPESGVQEPPPSGKTKKKPETDREGR